MPFYPKSSFFSRNDPNVLAARRVHCLELLEFSAKHPQLYNSQVFLNFFATVSSPTSLNSDEEIGQLMDQGQIMVSISYLHFFIELYLIFYTQLMLEFLIISVMTVVEFHGVSDKFD